MPDLEQRIRTWTAAAGADVEPVTLDEVLARATSASLPDPAAGAEQRSRRTWLAAAAVVILLAATLAAIGLLRPDDEGAVADVSPTMNRLLDLGPAEIADWGPLVIDLESAREDVDLALPPSGSSVEVIDDYFAELRDRLGVDPVGWSSFATELDGRSPTMWWFEVGIDPSRITGSASWGEPPDDRLVVIGEFDVDEIDGASRTNTGAERLSVSDHRGVTTYAWGEDFEMTDSFDTFPGFRNVQMAVIDDVVLLSRHIDSLHNMIDSVLDDSSSLAEDDDVQELLGALGEEAEFGVWFVGDTQSPFTSWVMATLGPEGSKGPPRYVAAVEHGTDASEVADGIRSRTDALVAEHIDDLPELGDFTMSVTSEGRVVVVDRTDAAANDPDVSQAVLDFYLKLERAIGIVPTQSFDDVD